jgi:Luciferase-like monooxygenase
MRFCTFVFSMSHDPREDHQVIENTMREVELAEAIGLDTVWLTEHHFDGAVAYGDPLVFGAAVAMRTRQVRIGFAVVGMATGRIGLFSTSLLRLLFRSSNQVVIYHLQARAANALSCEPHAANAAKFAKRHRIMAVRQGNIGHRLVASRQTLGAGNR